MSKIRLQIETVQGSYLMNLINNEAEIASESDEFINSLQTYAECQAGPLERIVQRENDEYPPACEQDAVRNVIDAIIEHYYSTVGAIVSDQGEYPADDYDVESVEMKRQQSQALEHIGDAIRQACKAVSSR